MRHHSAEERACFKLTQNRRKDLPHGQQTHRTGLEQRRLHKIIRDTYEGTLVMCQENVPYAVPINHAFVDGKFFFHCAMRGRKLDVIKNNPNVVYVISRYYGAHENLQTPKCCHGPWESIIAYGTARIIEDIDGKAAAFTTFMKYYGNDFKMTSEGRDKTLAIIMDITSMTATAKWFVLKKSIGSGCQSKWRRPIAVFRHSLSWHYTS